MFLSHTLTPSIVNRCVLNVQNGAPPPLTTRIPNRPPTSAENKHPLPTLLLLLGHDLLPVNSDLTLEQEEYYG